MKLEWFCGGICVLTDFEVQWMCLGLRGRSMIVINSSTRYICIHRVTGAWNYLIIQNAINIFHSRQTRLYSGDSWTSRSRGENRKLTMWNSRTRWSISCSGQSLLRDFGGIVGNRIHWDCKGNEGYNQDFLGQILDSERSSYFLFPIFVPGYIFFCIFFGASVFGVKWNGLAVDLLNSDWLVILKNWARNLLGFIFCFQSWHCILCLSYCELILCYCGLSASDRREISIYNAEIEIWLHKRL